jgi:hypothetical protein
MSSQMDLKDAEQRVFKLATFQDGLWDIFLGSCLILMSIFSLTRGILGPKLNLLVIVLTLLVLVILVGVTKRRLTFPRTGLVRFGPETRKRIKAFQIITWVLVAATFALLILGKLGLINEPVWRRLPNWVSDLDVDIFFALIIVGLFAVIAHSYGIARLYLYGWLMGIGMLVSTALFLYQGSQFQYPLAIAGVIVLTIGVVVLVRFLRDYPLPSQEA